ncbi:laccase [Striga asiatica]|uniref:Laccase n=1 Tax=Striga asiatica TaxID=4170 RepID=A0A5A7PCD1_STRAF|nr:laccase [Striga asiatica]
MNAATFLLSLLSILLSFAESLAHAETHYHDFTVEQTSITRLCSTRNIITVNGQFPGPTIAVRNGDSLVIKVTNKAPYNVTLHWHGIRQMRTPWADGPEYVTQCPIKPGSTYTYRFKIEDQEGTLWWHAHSKWLRATVYGALVIYPKFGASYPFPAPKIDVPLILGEWWDRNIVDVLRQALLRVQLRIFQMHTRSTVNLAIFTDAQAKKLTINTIESKHTNNKKTAGTVKIRVNSGDKILLRVINAALNQQLFFSVASHRLTVVSTDASYTKPSNSDFIMLGPGQTTDVLLTADQTPALYYLAARAYASAPNVPFDNTTTTAILEYSGAGTMTRQPVFPRLPAFNDTSSATSFTTSLRGAATSSTQVVVPTRVDESLVFTVGLGLVNCTPPGGPTCMGPNGTRFAASMNNVSFVLPNTTSLLQAYYYHYGRTPGQGRVFTTDFPGRLPLAFDYTGKNNNVSRGLWQPSFGTRLYRLEYGSSVQVVLQGTSIFAVEDHPIHLHGYHFFVVGQGFGNFDPERDTGGFNLEDPPVRNTIDVPVGGWAVIRFVADNPGVWLFHCHIDSHLSWGLGMAFLVENGKGESESIEPPPEDLPQC